MSRLPTVTPREVLRALQRVGFKLDHVSGSHYVLRHPDGRRTVVPYHRGRDIKRGVLRSVITQTGISTDEFIKLL